MIANYAWRRSVAAAVFIAGFFSQWFTSASALAVTRVYDIVTNQSSIALSGSVTTSFGTAPIQQQGPGSLVTSYAGNIRTDRGASDIRFLLGSSIDANVSGSWQPLPNGDAGSAPADYGARVSFLFGAISANVTARNLVAGMTSGIIPVGSSGTFDLSAATFIATSGEIAYRSTLGQAGSDSIAGESGALNGTGSLNMSSAGGDTIETLSIPISTTIPLTIDATTSVNLVLTGQLVATATILPGDFNGDETVDAADYVVWRKGVGVESTPANYNLWRTNFGRTSAGAGAASVASDAAVPEPINFMPLALSVAALGRRRRARCAAIRHTAL